MASILGSLGSVYGITGASDKASQYLHAGLDAARQSGDAALTAKLLNNLGGLLTMQQQLDEALAVYRESLELAQASTDRVLAVKALTNAARTAIPLGQYREAVQWLDRAWEQMRDVVSSHDKAYGLLSLGRAYERLRAHLPNLHEALLARAAEAFQAAVDVATALGDVRSSSYAWGYLGNLYAQEHRYREALQLTRRAVFAAQRVNAPESLYRWEWQTGRLLRALGDPEEAIAAYQRAVQTLQTLRAEMSRGYGTRPSFRKEIQPVYFELVDLLLRRAAVLPQRSQYEPYLMAARNAVEAFKVAELQDYFLDDCVDETRLPATQLEEISHTAVIVYPILLPDRTELLVSLPSGLERFAVPVGADTMTREVRQFRRSLENRTIWQFQSHAEQLYDWLIRPFAVALKHVPVRTLVFVPDGPLRTIPMAALHDGKQFLIHNYAVATTPGLTLTQPQPLPRSRIKVLAVGLTEPVQGFTPLPHVSAEVKTIRQLYEGTMLLNGKFNLSNIEAVLRRDQFAIMHVASHGQFDREAQGTFLLTFDGKLTIDRLDELVGDFWPRDTPLELLTLSACETAAGDDRAALGLAGVAIKAGARSALATLWSVNDQASAALVIEFYRQLQDPSVSRAVALQRAQLTLLKEPRYAHPGYWAPFLLLNNWL